ncbi:unnamed protein product [Amoebophrya sp. A25]|nr:unnamed protein product [Amoebophrya sp. A25]|eukprot:GSA25T00020974001.1
MIHFHPNIDPYSRKHKLHKHPFRNRTKEIYSACVPAKAKEVPEVVVFSSNEKMLGAGHDRRTLSCPSEGVDRGMLWRISADDDNEHNVTHSTEMTHRRSTRDLLAAVGSCAAQANRPGSERRLGERNGPSRDGTELKEEKASSSTSPQGSRNASTPTPSTSSTATRRVLSAFPFSSSCSTASFHLGGPLNESNSSQASTRAASTTTSPSSMGNTNNYKRKGRLEKNPFSSSSQQHPFLHPRRFILDAALLTCFAFFDLFGGLLVAQAATVPILVAGPDYHHKADICTLATTVFAAAPKKFVLLENKPSSLLNFANADVAAGCTPTHAPRLKHFESVFKSLTADDDVVLFLVGLGGYRLFTFPTADGDGASWKSWDLRKQLTRQDLYDTIHESSFKSLLIYADWADAGTMFRDSFLPSNAVALTVGSARVSQCFHANAPLVCKSNVFTQAVMATHGATLKAQARALIANFEDLEVHNTASTLYTAALPYAAYTAYGTVQTEKEMCDANSVDLCRFYHTSRSTLPTLQGSFHQSDELQRIPCGGWRGSAIEDHGGKAEMLTWLSRSRHRTCPRRPKALGLRVVRKGGAECRCNLWYMGTLYVEICQSAMESLRPGGLEQSSSGVCFGASLRG